MPWRARGRDRRVRRRRQGGGRREWSRRRRRCLCLLRAVELLHHMLTIAARGCLNLQKHCPNALAPVALRLPAPTARLQDLPPALHSHHFSKLLQTHLSCAPLEPLIVCIPRHASGASCSRAARPPAALHGPSGGAAPRPCLSVYPQGLPEGSAALHGRQQPRCSQRLLGRWRRRPSRR